VDQAYDLLIEDAFKGLQHNVVNKLGQAVLAYIGDIE
jgi:hypothetical protein